MFLGGGVQEVVLALQKGLVKRGHDAHIITPQPRDYNGPAQPEGIIMVGGATKWKGYGTTTQFSASVDLDKLTEMLERENFDILHFHEPWAPMLSRQMLSRSNAINIGTFHAAIPDRMMGRTIEKVITPYTKSILKYLDVLTAVSPAAAKYASSLTDQKINIVANGIDLRQFSCKQSEDKARKEKTIFYVGRLEKRKGLKYLIKAFALLEKEDSDFHLVIAGDGPDREKLEELAEDKGVQNIEFLGYIDDHKKTKLFADSTLFCSPAVYGESFGIVLLEAMASGCVVVAGNNPGYESVLDGRGQLSVVNPADTAEFARRLKLLSTDNVLRKAWREWALDRVKANDYENIIDQYENIYKKAYDKR